MFKINVIIDTTKIDFFKGPNRASRKLCSIPLDLTTEIIKEFIPPKQKAIVS
jgi:hypothetical protein